MVVLWIQLSLNIVVELIVHDHVFVLWALTLPSCFVNLNRGAWCDQPAAPMDEHTENDFNLCNYLHVWMSQVLSALPLLALCRLVTETVSNTVAVCFSLLHRFTSRFLTIEGAHSPMQRFWLNNLPKSLPFPCSTDHHRWFHSVCVVAVTMVCLVSQSQGLSLISRATTHFWPLCLKKPKQ